MIPGNAVTVREVLTPIRYPDRDKTVGLTDQEMGGIAINDPSQGLSDWLWTCTVVDNTVTLTREGTVPVSLFTQPDMVDISLAFTQNMQPTIAWQDTTGNIWLRWYDSINSVYTLTNFGEGRSPRLTLDDKRQISLNSSDILLAYITVGKLVYRQQRDSFLTEYVLATGIPAGQKLQHLGMGGLQLQFELL